MRDREDHGWTEEARREAELLESILNPGSGSGSDTGSDTGATGPADARRAAELEAFLGTCRAAFATDGEDDAVGARRLAERILARTTREDLSWRGDLRLVAGFLRKRLAESVVLRVVAASLLVHLIVAPSVLAYYMLVKPAREVNVKFDFYPRVIVPPVSEPERSIETPPLDPGDQEPVVEDAGSSGR